MPISLPANLAEQIVAAADSCGVSRMVLFGSRARGDHQPVSDIDLAAWGLDASQAGKLRLLLEDLPTLLRFDLVAVGPNTSLDLLANIEQEGVTLYAADEV